MKLFKSISYAVLVSAGFSVQAQQVVKIVVPFPPGGSTDTLSRTIGGNAGASGKTFIIDNKSGAGGAIGFDTVAKSPADGSTVGILTSDILRSMRAAGVAIPQVDVIAAAGLQGYVVVVPSGSPISSVKAIPNNAVFGSAGTGSTSEICAMGLGSALGRTFTHVPYKGSAPVMADLLGKQIEFACLSIPSVVPHISAGNLKALAVALPSRSALLPAVATLEELGVTDAPLYSWTLIVAPVGVPENMRRELTDVFARAINTTSPQLQSAGYEPIAAADNGDIDRLRGFLQRRLNEARTK